MYDVVCVGSAVRDFFLKSKAFKVISGSEFVTGEAQCFTLGAKITLDDYLVEVGGGAVNAAITFARQGLKTAIISRVGDDPSGKEIIAKLTKEGVDTTLVSLDTQTHTGSSFILLATGGERTILTYAGAMANFQASHIPFDSLQTRWLYVSPLSGHIELLNQLVNWADKNQVKLAVNPGQQELQRGVAHLARALSLANVFIVNHFEASLLTGVDYHYPYQVTHALCLLTRGLGVVTQAERGAIACDAKHYYQIGSHQVAVVDTTGAGDAFASGLVAGLMRFGGLVEPALQLAADNAASVISHLGAVTGILRKDGPVPFKQRLKVKVTKIRSS